MSEETQPDKPKPRKAKKNVAPKVFVPRKGMPDSDEIYMIDYVRNQTAGNAWFYKDRCGVSRGPAPITTMREAWVHGLVDENTLVWGEGLGDFLPIKNVRTLIPQIRIPEGEQPFALPRAGGTEPPPTCKSLL